MSEKTTEPKLVAAITSEEYDLGIKGCYGDRITAIVEYKNGTATAVEVDGGRYAFTNKHQLARFGQILVALSEKMPEPAPPKPRKPRKRSAKGAKKATRRSA